MAQLKILADRNSDGNLSLQERQHGDAVEILRRNKIPLIDDREDGSKGSGLMHHKFLVIDGLSVITGSANFSSSG
ncbi:MAG: phospholipase D-like domain-containing protein, partial [Prochlorococcus sp.]